MIPVLWLSYNPDSPHRGYWDMGMLEDIFSASMWTPPNAYEYVHHMGLQGLQAIENDYDGMVLIIPARSNTTKVQQINKIIDQFKWVVLILTGDEEASFPVEKIKHDNIRIWVMSPREGRHDCYGKLGTGYPPQARRYLANMDTTHRDYDYFFGGQITHKRRYEMADQLKALEERGDLNGKAYYTDGFTKGETPELYYNYMAHAKVAPAPSGPETPDSFRLFEALEAGCIPLADTHAPSGEFSDNYWTWFFGEEPPFPIISDYEQLVGYTLEAVDNYTSTSNKIYAWWQQYKRRLVYDITRDIAEVSGVSADHAQQVTVVITSSPIPSHPSTKILEETIETIRTHLPDAEIIIGFDGVRPEQEDRRQAYEEYIHRALWLCNFGWSNVLPVVYDEHLHQATMTRKLLDYVKTPAMLFVEHDTPITPDRVIDWGMLTAVIIEGGANVIRLHHEELILPEHEHLMLPTQDVYELMRTMQWSQRPHLASTAFYRWMLETYFNPESHTMIEDVIHGIVQDWVTREAFSGWKLWRLWLYTPHTDDLGIKRSYHLDGRETDPKFEMEIKPVEVK